MYSLALIIFVVSEKKAFEYFPIGSNVNLCPVVAAILDFRSAWYTHIHTHTYRFTKLSLQLFLIANLYRVNGPIDMRVCEGHRFENILKLDRDNDVSGRRFEEWTSIRDWTSILVYHIYIYITLFLVRY